MPITWRIASDGRYVVFSVADPYTMDEWREAAGTLLTAPLADRYVPILVDRRHAEPLTTQSVEDMVRFAEQHEERIGSRRIAILVSDDANFGMGRMTALRATIAVPDAAIRPFRTYEAAIDWLGSRA
jgi:hypothetical protein